jgi:hypothetical protein
MIQDDGVSSLLFGSSISTVLLCFFNKVAGTTPRKIPPVFFVEVYRTMASHTCVNFSLLTVLRIM